MPSKPLTGGFIAPCLPSNGPIVFAHVCRMGFEEHRLEADGCTLSQRPVEDVAQVEEPDERGGAAGARGGVVGSIDVMRLDRTLGQSRHVGLRIRLSFDENFP